MGTIDFTKDDSFLVEYMQDLKYEEFSGWYWSVAHETDTLPWYGPFATKKQAMTHAQERERP